jgi:hypothetical protein
MSQSSVVAAALVPLAKSALISLRNFAFSSHAKG